MMNLGVVYISITIVDREELVCLLNNACVLNSFIRTFRRRARSKNLCLTEEEDLDIDWEESLWGERGIRIVASTDEGYVKDESWLATIKAVAEWTWDDVVSDYAHLLLEEEKENEE